MEEYDDKLAAVFSSLEKKIYRLKADVKNRKFRHQPGRLEENIISCSQHSVLQSSQVRKLLDLTESVKDWGISVHILFIIELCINKDNHLVPLQFATPISVCQMRKSLILSARGEF